MRGLPSLVPGGLRLGSAPAPAGTRLDKQSGIYISIGSNREPAQNIPRCLQMLADLPESSLRSQSSRYRTRPWGFEDQSDFVNLVVGLDSHLDPHALLRETQFIEDRLGRVRTRENGPRTIDLDILLFGERILDEDRLAIPHPGLLLRDFMLVPLIEIAPDAVHPIRGRPVGILQGEIRYRQIIETIPSLPPAG